MAKAFKKDWLHRVVNPLMMTALRLGVGPVRSRILVTVGRRSGRRYETPVNLVMREGKRYIVSPYGSEGWARNARVAGSVGLRRRGMNEDVTILEVSPEEAAPVLRQYLRENPITRPYFNVDASAPDSGFLAQARGHPVFRILESHPPS